VGIEYQIRFAAEAGAGDALLRRLDGWREGPDWFGYGGAPDAPDATAWADADGILLCDHLGGEGRRALGALVAALTGYGPVTVEEL
jgi:hypothetical protein